MKTAKRYLALLMCILMCLSLLPAEVFAESEDSVDFSAAEEIDIDPSEVDDAASAEESAEPSESEEESAEPTETADAETVEDSAAANETAGFPGMGEGYVLSEEQVALKADLAANDVPATLADLTEGVDYVAGELIAIVDTEEEAQQFADAFDADLKDYSYGVVTLVLRSASVLEAVTAAADPDVCLPAVEPNYIITNEPIESELTEDAELDSEVPVKQSWKSWYENSANPDPAMSYPNASFYQWMHDMVNTYEAWGVTTGDPSIKVAIVDCGVDTTDPDLEGRVETIDIGLGTEPVGEHATALASLIAATVDNGYNGAGIAPGVSIMSIRYADDDGGQNVANCLIGINAAVSNGANIINCSFGNYEYSAYENDVIQRAIGAGIFVVAAMGNDGSNIKCYPAAYKNVFAVAAVDEQGNRAYLSNYGSWCDIAAPGMNIFCDVPDNGYGIYEGTSLSCAIVSGVAALYMSKMGPQSPATMTSVLKKAVNECSSSGMGAGIIDASKLFSTDKTAPIITLLNENGEAVSASSGISAQGQIRIDFGDSANDDNRIIVYTLNGKDPVIKNGELTTGEIYTGPLTPYEIADVGDTITIKAAVVSGMGVLSKITTVTVKVVSGAAPTSVTILTNGVIESTAGATLRAKVTPAYASQKVTWTVVKALYADKYDYTSVVTIDAKGNLTFPRYFYGTVTVRATSAVDSTVYSEDTALTISYSKNPSTKVSLPKSATAYLSKEDWMGISVTGTVYYADGTWDNTVSLFNTTGVMCFWKSSNTKVVTVDEYGSIIPVGVGTATVTCKVLDGSNKSATMKVTVKRWVDTISISGQDSIAPGASCTFTATVKPSKAANKNVTWTLTDAPSGVTVSSKGKVTVPAYVTSGSFTLTATAADGSGISCSKTIDVRAKTTTLSLYTSSEDYGLKEVYNKKNSLTSMMLYNVAPVGYIDDNNNDPHTAQLQAYTSVSGTALVWSSDKPSVATVDSTGKVTAVKAGTAKITCKANDGSGKTATCTVTVTVPVSTIYIEPNLRSSQGYYNLGLGKSCTFKVTAGDTYGKPTNTKVKWTYTVVEMDYDSTNSKYNYYDITSYATSNGYVKFSNGKLTTSKKFVNYWKNTNGIYVIVGADTTDGTNIGYSTKVYLQPCTTTMTPHLITTISTSSGYIYNPTVLKGAIINQSDTLTSYGDNGCVMVLTDSTYLDNFVASSSNPDICGVHILDYDYNNNGIVLGLTAGTKTGIVKITVKACDGSGKSCTFSIKVNE